LWTLVLLIGKRKRGRRSGDGEEKRRAKKLDVGGVCEKEGEKKTNRVQNMQLWEKKV